MHGRKTAAAAVTFVSGIVVGRSGGAKKIVVAKGV